MKKAGLTFIKQKDGRYCIKGKNIYVTKEDLSAHTDAEILEAYKRIIKKRIKRKFINDQRVRRIFSSIFGVSLSIFCDPVFAAMTGDSGFDIVAFDRWLRTPSGISTQDYIIKTYGKKAAKLIQKLI